MMNQIKRNIKAIAIVIIAVVGLSTGCKSVLGSDKELFPCAVYVDSINDLVWGYMDSTGQMVIEPQFHYANEFVNGYAEVFVCKHRGWTCVGARGVIDKRGNMVIPPNYDEIGHLSDGFIRLSHPDKKDEEEFVDGYYNIKHELVYPCELNDFKFDQNHDFSEGLAVVCPPVTLSDYDRIVKGEMIMNFYPYMGYKYDKKVSSTNNLYGYINVEGDMEIPNKFDYALDFSEGLAFARLFGDEKVGFINKDGEFAIEPQFLNGSSFSEGLAAVLLENRKWGFVNKEGEMVIPAQYKRVGDFNEGMAWVEIYDTGKYGYINKKGEKVIEPIYDHAGNFYDGLAAVDTSTSWRSKYGFINMNGELVIPYKYSSAMTFYPPEFKSGICLVSVEETDSESGEKVKKAGYINKNNEWIYGPIIGGSWSSYSYNIE